ncbi:hypothetical protein D3C72_1986970 [compost metagenome]
MRATTGFGVVAGKKAATQAVISYPGRPLSAMVGTLASRGWRLDVVTATARSLPFWIRGRAGLMSEIMKSTWWPIKSVRACGTPL